MPHQEMPTPEDVSKLLTGLLSRRTVVKRASAWLDAAKQPVWVGDYLADAGAVDAAFVCELPLAGFLGAALAMIPPKIAVDAAKAGKLPADISENFREVVNVVSATLNHGTVHVRLGAVAVKPGGAAALPSPLQKGPVRRLDLDVSVDGYGAGKMCLVRADHGAPKK